MDSLSSDRNDLFSIATLCKPSVEMAEILILSSESYIPEVLDSTFAPDISPLALDIMKYPHTQ